MNLQFTVYGTPQPQGSARAFMPKSAKHPVITSDNPKLKSWRQELTQAAMIACHDSKFVFPAPPRIPLQVTAVFFFKPPKKVNCFYKTTRPDVDKLLRALLDGMAGVLYMEDSLVCSANVVKQYNVPERVEITVTDIEEES